jgi:hypothetical protein
MVASTKYIVNNIKSLVMFDMFHALIITLHKSKYMPWSFLKKNYATLEMSLVLVFGHPQTVDTGVLSGCEMGASRYVVLSVTPCMSENVI